MTLWLLIERMLMDHESCLQGKWVKFSVKGRGRAAVRERRAEGRSVANYLALPVEEYSLLDPSWIKREPGSDTFCLSAPLRGITGLASLSTFLQSCNPHMLFLLSNVQSCWV